MYRTNAQSRALEDAFVARGMPYQLVGGTRFYQRKEIKHTLADLRVVHNPADNISLTRVINVPPRAIGEKTVSSLASWCSTLGLPMTTGLALLAGDLGNPALAEHEGMQSGKPLEHPFSGGALRALTAFYRLLAGWQAVSDKLTVADLLERIAEESGYATWLRDGTEEGEDRWNNLQELRSVAAHYEEFPPELRLTAFLEEVALVSDQDELAENKDRVTLLTLHTAKGLEFPVVFLTGLEENILLTAGHGCPRRDGGRAPPDVRRRGAGKRPALSGARFPPHAFRPRPDQRALTFPAGRNGRQRRHARTGTEQRKIFVEPAPSHRNSTSTSPHRRRTRGRERLGYQETRLRRGPR
jgi:superfamily I DNA/RNA helicase